MVVYDPRLSKGKRINFTEVPCLLLPITLGQMKLDVSLLIFCFSEVLNVSVSARTIFLFILYLLLASHELCFEKFIYAFLKLFIFFIFRD